jgi:hypothetical protein
MIMFQGLRNSLVVCQWINEQKEMKGEVDGGGSKVLAGWGWIVLSSEIERGRKDNTHGMLFDYDRATLYPLVGSCRFQ